ncbi:MAG TPA: hypothetical protein PKW36_12565 [bacterium]|nr:hypothetical protein [bacterium]
MPDFKPLHVIQTSSDGGCINADETRLIGQGWQRRYVADPRAAQEAKLNYEEMGFEVQLLPTDVQSVSAECNGCRAAIEKYQIIYTRKSS